MHGRRRGRGPTLAGTDRQGAEQPQASAGGAGTTVGGQDAERRAVYTRLRVTIWRAAKLRTIHSGRSTSALAATSSASLAGSSARPRPAQPAPYAVRVPQFEVYV